MEEEDRIKGMIKSVRVDANLDNVLRDEGWDHSAQQHRQINLELLILIFGDTARIGYIFPYLSHLAQPSSA